MYFFRYCKKLVIPPKSAMAFGSATHESIRANNYQKKTTHTDTKLSVLQDIFEMKIKTTEIALNNKEGETKEKLIDEGTKKIIPLYHKELAPQCQPIIVEERIQVKFENAEWVYTGRIDLVNIQENIIDYKCVGKTPSEKKVLFPDPQLTGYALCYRQKTGHLPNRTYHNYLIRTKKPKALITPEGERTTKDINIYLRLVMYIAEQIEQERFYPNYTSYLCNEQYCGFFPYCQKEWGSL